MKMDQSFREKCRARQLGRKHSLKTRERMSLKQKGVKKNLSLEARKRIGAAHRGPNSHWWQGGKTAIRQKIYNSLRYREWRRKIFERDEYKCTECGACSGHGKRVILNADHIKPFALYPKLRFTLNNGRTLCRECHRKTRTYGWLTSRRTRVKLSPTQPLCMANGRDTIKG